MGNIFQKIPFLRIFFSIASGIVLAEYFPSVKPIIVIILIGLVIFIYHLLNKRITITNAYLPGIFLSAGLTFAGFAFHDHKKLPHGLSQTEKYLGILLETPEEKNRTFKAEFLIKYALGEDSIFPYHEKIIVYLKKDSSSQNLKPGDNIILLKKPVEIKNFGNPHEFDYRKYLARRGIYRQVYLNQDEWKRPGKIIPGNIRTMAEKIRDMLLEIYRSAGVTGQEYQVLSALTLGYRKAMDPEVKKVFTSVGATHILSVSGLHVGIIYIVLNTLFGFLKRIRKTKVPYIVFLLTILWFYAMITGFSPPVLRATIMFSMILIGENMRKPVSIYNTLAASATLLLIINSNWIFDIGFQLSYMAILGILLFHPLFDSIFEFKSLIWKYILGLITVSLSAQIGTFPLTIFYFNQFPVYFLISNLIIIPLSFIFICSGFLIISTFFIPIIPTLIASVNQFLLHYSLAALQGIENLPGSLIRNIQISQTQLFLLLFLIPVIICFINLKKPVYLRLSILTCIFIFGLSGYKIYQTLTEKRIIAYNTVNYPVLHLISGRNNYVLSDPGTVDEDIFLKNNITNVVAKSGLNQPVYLNLNSGYENSELMIHKNIICFAGRIFTVVNKISDKLPDFHYDFIVLKNDKSNPKPGLSESKIPIICYIDGNNNKNSNFYSVTSSGAFLFDF